MDFNSILNQVLGAAKGAANNQNSAGQIGKFGGGAAAIGILSMLLGKKGGASLTKMGTLAALGSLAYQAYQNYQKAQPQTAQPLEEEAFNPENHQESGNAVLRAMIAAAVSDGLLDEQEKQAIFVEAGEDPELKEWIMNEINHPASVEVIAQQVANNSALAAQVYLAARMVCGDLSRKEIVFLAQLADALHLDESFVEQLEKEAGF
ncbi:tellurite resistance TerB family protein [Conservatibacter flavescens]|uniref:DUF533 domain-containing protein n=1 Tax=Conservatibacter flavescens TaxID=28161 RepID=A0A2M8S5Y8_9PAST|nr:DUF533 domain-containing protein [Conservatibacter flavescens]PJG86523.1 DUF533 domain-containing protein [Conservatibacter flavescens]